MLQAIASRVEAIAIVVSSRVEAIASRVEGIILVGWRMLEAIASRVEAIEIRLQAIASRWPSLVGWRLPSLLGCRPSLAGWRPRRPSLVGLEAIAYWVGGRH